MESIDSVFMSLKNKTEVISIRGKSKKEKETWRHHQATRKPSINSIQSIQTKVGLGKKRRVVPVNQCEKWFEPNFILPFLCDFSKLILSSFSLYGKQQIDIKYFHYNCHFQKIYGPNSGPKYIDLITLKWCYVW